MIIPWIPVLLGLTLGVIIGAVSVYIYHKSQYEENTKLNSMLKSQLDNVDLEIQKKTAHAEQKYNQIESKIEIQTNKLQELQSIIKEKQELQKDLDIEVKSLRHDADNIIKSAEDQAKKLQEFAKQESEKLISRLDNMQIKLEEKEHKLDQKIEDIEKQKTQLNEKQNELQHLYEQENIKLSEISGYTVEQAKDEFITRVTKQYSDDLEGYIVKLKNDLAENADKIAVDLISKAIPKIATDNTSEYTVTTVDIPSEDIKGKLIGREGRNVSVFEKITGVEMLIDDTPLIIRLSSYDHEKRRVAEKVVKSMIKDGRINPVYIEKTYNEISAILPNLLVEKGKEALQMVGLPPQHPDITRYIGQFYLRYSYGHNLWIHSIEVAKLSEIIANELGLDGDLAKKAGLLHDIGKVIAEQGQSHTVVGGEVLRKYNYDAITINTAEGHHHDIVMIDPIGWVVAAADAISASRPGARFNTKQFFIEKMTKLENLISEVAGVEKVHIMQAGREIMVFVDPQEIDDLGLQTLIRDIAIKVEGQLDFPGMIRVVAIRENKVTDYLR